MKRVEGHSHLYRDENSGAIINTNNSAYRQRLKAISISKTDKGELNKLREEIDELKMLLKKLTDNTIS